VKRVAKGVFQRPGGGYAVRVRNGTKYASASFPTLEQAEAWRDEIIAKRPGATDSQSRVRVEEGIHRRAGGTYAANVSIGNQTRRASFKTLSEARAWRRELIAKRPPRERGYAKGVNALHMSTWEPEDTRREREQMREQILTAPRKTVKRAGKQFTLVQLPPARHAPTCWREPSLRQVEAA
jgi:hypothetical protein